MVVNSCVFWCKGKLDKPLCLFNENDYSALSNSLYNMSREPTPIILIVNNAAASCSGLNVCKLEPTVS